MCRLIRGPSHRIHSQWRILRLEIDEPFNGGRGPEGYFSAYDPTTGELVWRRVFEGYGQAGAVVTAGGAGVATSSSASRCPRDDLAVTGERGRIRCDARVRAHCPRPRSNAVLLVPSRATLQP